MQAVAARSMGLLTGPDEDAQRITRRRLLRSGRNGTRTRHEHQQYRTSSHRQPLLPLTRRSPVQSRRGMARRGSVVRVR